MVGTPAASNALRVHFGEFEIDEKNAMLLRSGNPLALAPTPFGLLCALLRQPGSLLTKHALLDEVWGHRFVSDSVLKGAISDIRTVLGDDPRQPRYIETVPRRGYRFIARLTPRPGRAAETQRPVESNPAQLPLPPGEFALPESASLFVGRTKELAQLRRAWERAAGGRRSMVWIGGEPGIGKTTLVDYFVRSLGAVPVARGQCVQHHGQTEPYLPVLEALGELSRKDPACAELLRGVAPTWLLQLPWLSTPDQREALLRELVGANPQRMLREFGEFIDRYSERAPLLLVTEDMHWSDPSTLQLIDYIARRRNGSRLMWLATFRLTEVIALDHPLNTLRLELRQQGLLEEIPLDSFSEEELALYVAARAPEKAGDEKFVLALHERTGGMPLFVAAIAGAVLEGRTSSQSEGDLPIVGAQIPETLAALIDGYLGRLVGRRRSLLIAAAACGEELRLDTLSRVLEWDPLQVVEVCDELVQERSWLVRKEPASDDGESQYRFRHALFRQRLYEQLPASVRLDLHRRIGLALEAQHQAGEGIATSEIARHFELGRSMLAALRYYAEAARSALEHLSPVECLDLTARALMLAGRMPSEPERDSWQITLETLRGVAAFHAQGTREVAKHAYRRACDLLDTVPTHQMAGLALQGLGFLLYLRGEYGEALAVAAHADKLAVQNDDPLLKFAANTIRGQVLTTQGKLGPACEAFESLLPWFDLARSEDRRVHVGFIADPEVSVLAMSSLPLAQSGQFTQARQRLQAAYARARLLAQPMALMITLWFDALVGIRQADPARVGALAVEMMSLVERFALAQGRAATGWFHGWAEAHAGKPLAGFQQIRRAYEENRSLGMLAGNSETLAYAAEALLLLGDVAGAQEQLDQAFEIAQSFDERIYLPQLLIIQAGIRQLASDSQTAAAHLRCARDEARSQKAPWLETWALVELCEGGSATRLERTELSALLEVAEQSLSQELLERARRIIMK